MGQTHQSIEILVPADIVWNRVRNFNDMSWAPNVIQETRAIGETNGGQVGSRRLLNAPLSSGPPTLKGERRCVC